MYVRDLNDSADIHQVSPYRGYESTFATVPSLGSVAICIHSKKWLVLDCPTAWDISGEASRLDGRASRLDGRASRLDGRLHP